MPSNPENLSFPITHLYPLLTKCVSYYPNHVQSGGQRKSMANEICGSNNWSELIWETILRTTKLSI